MIEETDTKPEIEINPVSNETAPTPSRLEKFVQTSTAAKLSGTFNESAGRLKRKIGEITDDATLKDAGLNQELLGKIHKLVGSVREIRETAQTRFEKTKVEGQKILRKHGARLLDVAIDFVDDVKKLLK